MSDVSDDDATRILARMSRGSHAESGPVELKRKAGEQCELLLYCIILSGSKSQHVKQIASSDDVDLTTVTVIGGGAGKDKRLLTKVHGSYVYERLLFSQSTPSDSTLLDDRVASRRAVKI